MTNEGKRYIFSKANGRTFESDLCTGWMTFCAQKKYEFVQDRITGERFAIKTSGPIHLRMQKIAKGM